jgi:acetate kinase
MESVQLFAEPLLILSQAEDILNKQSGWKAMCGTADFSKIATSAAKSSHRLALNVFVDRIISFIGSYYVKLEGKVDALVFTGGIGEKSTYLRAEVVERVSCLGFSADESKNDGVVNQGATKIGTRVFVCPTDEEGEMSRRVLESM